MSSLGRFAADLPPAATISARPSAERRRRAPHLSAPLSPSAAATLWCPAEPSSPRPLPAAGAAAAAATGAGTCDRANQAGMAGAASVGEAGKLASVWLHGVAAAWAAGVSKVSAPRSGLASGGPAEFHGARARAWAAAAGLPRAAGGAAADTAEDAEERRAVVSSSSSSPLPRSSLPQKMLYCEGAVRWRQANMGSGVRAAVPTRWSSFQKVFRR